jgi:uncharacterized protein (TIRG00374 family)
LIPRRAGRSIVPQWLRRGSVVLLLLLIVEYFVIPELVVAGKDIRLLERVNVGWLLAGVGLEAGALLCYALLTHTLLLGHRPGLMRLVRIVLSTTAVSHVIPGGAAGGAALGYRLLTAEGVEGTDAGFAMGTEAIGSALVLNALLWLAILISIPLAGLHPVYVAAALVGLLALFVATALVYTFTRGEQRSVRIVRAIGRHVPRIGADRFEQLVHSIGDSVEHLARNRAVRRRAIAWAMLNWILDAASLWTFVAAFGHFADPVELFVAYGIANVLGALPITPAGLGVIEVSAVALLVSFGITKAVATYAVLGWRFVNFWLPIPVGAGCYLSLRVPRGAGLGAGRRALSGMAREARNPPDVDEAEPGSNSESP